MTARIVDALDQLHDAHIRAYAWAQFGAALLGFTRSVAELRLQFAAGVEHAIRQHRADSAAHLADVIRNGT